MTTDHTPPTDQTAVRPLDRGAKAEALLLRFTAEAHLRKWNYDRGLDNDGTPVKSEAFDALHRLGEEMRVELETLRRMTDETQPAEHRPRRGDQFETWLKAQRDISTSWSAWRELDHLLDLYRLHADTGTPLGEHVCEGQGVGDCECQEQPAAAARQDDAQPIPTPAETADGDESPHVYMDAVQDSASWAYAFTKTGQIDEALEHVEAIERLLAVYRRAVTSATREANA